MFDRYLSGGISEMECARAEFWWVLRDHLSFKVVSAHYIAVSTSLCFIHNPNFI